MTQVLKAVILLFILVSVECKPPIPVLKEIISTVLLTKIEKISCGKTMVPEVSFKVKAGKESELFCKAAKALEKVNACDHLDVTGLRMNLNAAAEQNSNCAVNENNMIELKVFLNNLRKFSQRAISTIKE